MKTLFACCTPIACDRVVIYYSTFSPGDDKFIIAWFVCIDFLSVPSRQNFLMSSVNWGGLSVHVKKHTRLFLPVYSFHVCLYRTWWLLLQLYRHGALFISALSDIASELRHVICQQCFRMNSFLAWFVYIHHNMDVVKSMTGYIFFHCVGGWGFYLLCHSYSRTVSGRLPSEAEPKENNYLYFQLHSHSVRWAGNKVVSRAISTLD